MAKITFGRVNIGTSTEETPQAIPQPHGGPFKILILGDFSGRGHHTAPASRSELAQRRPYRVDPDTLETLPERLGAAIEIPLEGESTLPLEFHEIDDFHPDAIYRRVPMFEELEDLRERLDDPATFPQALREFQSAHGGGSSQAAGKNAEKDDEKNTGKASSSAPEVPHDIDPADLLDHILGGGAEGSPPAKPAKSSGRSPEIEALVHELVAPHLMPGRHADQDAAIENFHDVVSDLMRQVLHHPHFQQLEAAWRSVEWFSRKLEIDNSLQVELLDLSRAELTADLTDAESLKETALYQHCVGRPIDTPGGQAYALIVGNYTFSATVADAALLERIGLLAMSAGAPFLAAAGASLAGLSSFDEESQDEDFATPADAQTAWEQLRSQSEAQFLALTAPRFLLRLPYSEDTFPVESFDFREQTTPPRHHGYLWASGAFAYASLLGQAFMQHGWDLQPGVGGELAQLPVYCYEEDGATTARPCAELLLTQSDLEQWVQLGLNPLAAVRGTDRLMLPRLHSLSASKPTLAGRWV